MSLKASLQEALHLTRSQRLIEATHKIQSALSGQTQATIEPSPDNAKYPRKTVRPLAQVVQALQKLKQSPLALGNPGRTSTIEPEIVAGAQFLTRSFSCKAGSRSYRLYIPKYRPNAQRPLLIMLHGCRQNPSDFALGTRMNTFAETHGMLVAYPAQTQRANLSACWNWFNPSHQRFGLGEPAIIAGLTEAIVKTYDIDRRKVFVAGLSAGAAMAVIMGETYPKMFSAIGAHSGLPYRCANDVVSAFAAMRGDSVHRNTVPKLRTIVFHGDSDGIVAPSNGASIVGGATFSPLDSECVNGQYTRRVERDPNGLPLFEHWLLHGAAHAWSGGNPAGSYTSSTGPNASVEMLRFFLQGKDS